MLLQCALHWTCTKVGIEAFFGEETDGIIVHTKGDALFFQSTSDGGNVDAYDLFDFATREGMEQEDVVNAIDKLGAQSRNGRAVGGKTRLSELIDQLLSCGFRNLGVVGTLISKNFRLFAGEQVGSHDDDGVFEIHRATFVVGEATIIEHLQENVEDIGMGFFNLIEKHDRVGFATHGFGELSAFVITHISRRGTNQTRCRKLLLVFAHVDARHHVFIVKQAFCEGFCQFRLTHSRGTEEDERTDGTFGVLQTSTTAAHSVGHCSDGFVLSDDASVEFVFEVEQLLAFALEHASHGDARPATHHVGNVVGSDFFLHHSFCTLTLLEILMNLCNLRFKLLHLSIANLGYLAVVPFAFSALGFIFELFDLLLVVLNLCQQFAFAFPFSLQIVLFFLKRLNLLVERGEFSLMCLLCSNACCVGCRSILSSHLGFTTNGFAFDLQLTQST